jgi:hypothetical protein
MEAEQTRRRAMRSYGRNMKSRELTIGQAADYDDRPGSRLPFTKPNWAASICWALIEGANL